MNQIAHEQNLKRAAVLRGKAERYRAKAAAADMTEGERDFLRLAEPIKVGHHSERKHRKLLERARKKTEAYFGFLREAEKYEEEAGRLETLEPRKTERMRAMNAHLSNIDATAQPGMTAYWLGSAFTIKKVNKRTLTLLSPSGRELLADKTLCTLASAFSSGGAQ